VKCDSNFFQFVAKQETQLSQRDGRLHDGW